MSSTSFKEFAEGVRKSRKLPPDVFQGVTVLALDPGVTTGYAVLSNDELADYGQHKNDDVALAARFIDELMVKWEPRVVVVEDYRVYSWKQKQHAWSDLHTARLIGAIELVVQLRPMNIALVKYPASSAKGFCTDERLMEWGYYQKGLRHARDAIRHACYYALFGDTKLWQQNPTPRKGKKPDGSSKSRVG